MIRESDVFERRPAAPGTLPKEGPGLLVGPDERVTSATVSQVVAAEKVQQRGQNTQQSEARVH